MRKRNIKVIIISIILTCISGVILPLFMDKFIFANNYPSSLSNSDWSGFLGGIWGGIIGGIGTLIAVCVTTLDTRDVQEENRKQAAVANFKDKLQTIISTLASYWEKNSSILKTLLEIHEYKNEISLVEEKIDAISENLLYSTLNEEERKVLCDRKEEFILIKSNKAMEIEKLNEKNKDLINSVCYEYMLIKLLISDVDFSNKLMDLLNEIQCILTQIQQTENVSIEDLNAKTQSVQDTAKEFVSMYENTFIKLN